MKIVLIEPSPSKANAYSKLHMPLLGPVYLGTILKNKGYDVEIINENIAKPDYSKLKADLIGISILTSTAKRGYQIARKFSKEKVIIGGVHASLLPDEAKQFARQVVVGEAEEIIVDLVNGRIKDEIVFGKPIENLDSLPHPDFTLIRGFKSPGGFMPVSTSRGCPFDCSFCSVTKIFGRKYRFRSAQNVMDEFLLRKSAEIFFCDDNFTASPNRTRTLLNLMVKHKIKRWSCQVRADVAKDEELLKLMAKAGCKVACIGFESINAKTLAAFNKKQTVEEIVQAIRSFHKRKIKIHGMFVLGGDDDNKQTIWDTLRFAQKHKIDTIQLMILTPFPGTRVCDDLEKEKRIFSRDWNLYDGQHIVFKPKLLSPAQLQSNVVKAYKKFYSIPKSIALFTKLHLRNALFCLMGYLIVRKWLKRNKNMHWLP